MKAFVAVCCLLALSSAVPAFCETFEDSKNYYAPSPPDPNVGTPPVYSGSPPPHRTSPSHGSSPPHHHHHPTPSPPANCGNPPPYHVPTPTPTTPTTPITPSPPSGGSGGSYNPPYSGGTPPTPVGGNPPTTPIIPGTPLVPGTPTTPTVGSPPYVFDPNNPFPGTCNFWRNHPTLIWGLVGWFGTLGTSMGVPSVPGFPSNTNLLQALSNNRVDGYGDLYREGTASLLNSLASNRFPFSATQVRDSFLASLGSNQAAHAQARIFRLANEGHYRPRA